MVKTIFFPQVKIYRDPDLQVISGSINYYFGLFATHSLTDCRIDATMYIVTQEDLTQIFPTIPNPIVNLDFHMKTQGCDEYHIIGEIV